jgi:hypothetical protein
MVVMADSESKCFLFEAFYLNPREPFFEPKQGILAISLLDRESTAVLVTEAGRVIFVPITNPE